MRRLLLCLPLALAACASDQQRCIGSATLQVRQVQSAIATAQGNIARGYAVARVRDVRQETYPCVRTRRDGTEVESICTRQREFTREEPVAVSVAEERVKLRQLQARLAPLQRQANDQIALCRQSFPES